MPPNKSRISISSNNFSADEEDKTIPIPVEDTFHEYLEQQLGMLEWKDDREFLIAKQIIGSIGLTVGTVKNQKNEILIY